MTNIIRPGSPLNHRYTISKEDMEGMMKSGLPDEIVECKYIDNKALLKLKFGSDKPGWWIRVERKLYGEYYSHDSFVTHDLVQTGPDWVEEQHRIIDGAFEKTRLALPQARILN